MPLPNDFIMQNNKHIPTKARAKTMCASYFVSALKLHASFLLQWLTIELPLKLVWAALEIGILGIYFNRHFKGKRKVNFSVL